MLMSLIKVVALILFILGIFLSVIVLMGYASYRSFKILLIKLGEKLKGKNKSQKQELQYGLTDEMKEVLYRGYTPVGKKSLIEETNNLTNNNNVEKQLQFTMEDIEEVEELEDMDNKGLSAETLEIVKKRQEEQKAELIKSLKQEPKNNNNLELKVSEPNQDAFDLIKECQHNLEITNKLEDSAAERELIIMEEPPFIPNPEDYFGPANEPDVSIEEIFSMTSEESQQNEVSKIEAELKELGNIQGTENLGKVARLLIRKAQIEGDYEKVKDLEGMYEDELAKSGYLV
ncbi:hypothetical protein [Bacillus thuringiensis]|uniref:hypothetical protein n=1 Tax=Bacillus thuringiensis TaxID=1428 RepID=UPI0021D68BF5|nr:hypothetical protein [Bacillus thuringiensis]MCU7679436.1 hypothetical protein [Bacillus thuringiensis]